MASPNWVSLVRCELSNAYALPVLMCLLASLPSRICQKLRPVGCLEFVQGDPCANRFSEFGCLAARDIARMAGPCFHTCNARVGKDVYDEKL